MSRSVANQQAELLQEMRQDGIQVGCLPDAYYDVTWEAVCNRHKDLVRVDFTRDDKNVSAMQVALISYDKEDRMVVLAKPKKSLCYAEIAGEDQKLFDKLQEEFDKVLHESKK
jgi:hypothetical protein